MKSVEKEPPSSHKEVRTAAQAAMKYCRALFPTSTVTLEEVELSGDESHWLITLGVHDSQAALSNQVLKNMPWAIRPATKLKVFKVNSVTGEVVSMKIR